MSFISDFINGFKEYVTQTWKNRPSTETPLSAERLNHIEAGIKSISDAIKNMAAAIMDDLADLTIGASDWDAAEGEAGYVKNRTHWVEYVSKQEVILEETSVSFNSEMGSIYGLGTNKVISGKPYIVFWNGTAYECQAFASGQSVLLGNGYLVDNDLEDTGEPFGMEMLTAESAFVMKSTSDAETVNIKVETPEVVVYHPIDKRFLPDDFEGGVKSWNDLEDRPFYAEGGVVEILPETTLTYSADDDACPIPQFAGEVVAGEEYSVTYNGVEYECEAQYFNAEGMGYVLLGDASIVGLAGNGELFVAMFFSDTTLVEETGFSGMLMPLDGEQSPTFSISKNNETIQKLDNKFLDLNWKPIKSLKKGTLVDGETLTMNSGGVCTLVEEPFKLIVGESYTINIDDDLYEYTCKIASVSADGSTLYYYYLGNAYRMNNNLENTGEPFVWGSLYNGDSWMMSVLSSDTYKAKDVTVTITGPTDHYNKMPKEYMPESVDYVVMNSLTKKFKITVNDQGTISATEITE